MKPIFEVICLNNKGAEAWLEIGKIYFVTDIGITYYRISDGTAWDKTRFKMKIEHNLEQYIEGLLNEN